MNIRMLPIVVLAAMVLGLAGCDDEETEATETEATETEPEAVEE
jgi:type IV pilus biogenesis protein CpaD/CtpE